MSPTQDGGVQDFLLRLKRGDGPFSPKVALRIETDRFLVKTADRVAEVLAALQLRHEVFLVRELGKRLPHDVDIDAFDADSDHLLAIDRASGLVIGNYRVRCSRFHDRFYSEGEFMLEEFLGGDGSAKVEIGRACIHPGHRTGAVIQLLWRGLMEYVRKVDARFLFGCSSVPARTPGQVEAVWNFALENGLLSREFRAEPHSGFVMTPGLTRELLMPPLLGSYFRSGAKILGAPAYDPEFECADFLTTLDLRELSPRHARKFKACV